MSETSSIENRPIRGFTVKNIIMVVMSTASIVYTVVTTSNDIREQIKDLKNQQETVNRVNDIRLKILETDVTILKQEVQALQQNQAQSNNHK